MADISLNNIVKPRRPLFMRLSGFFFVFGEFQNGVEATRVSKNQSAYTLNNIKRIGNKK